MAEHPKGESPKFNRNLKEDAKGGGKVSNPAPAEKPLPHGQSAIGAKRSDGANKGGGAKGSSGGRRAGSD